MVDLNHWLTESLDYTLDSAEARINRLATILGAATSVSAEFLAACLEAERTTGVHAGCSAAETTELWCSQFEAVMAIIRSSHPSEWSDTERKALCRQLAEACLGLAGSALATLVESEYGVSEDPPPHQQAH